MSILVIGAEGNMGRRYSAILDHLGVAHEGVDKAHSSKHVMTLAVKSSGIILATPTTSHAADIRRLLPAKRPILCEKPITKDLFELRSLLSEVDDSRVPLRMVYQYSILAPQVKAGNTFYNYYKHGGDGLAWDCMQIIGLANGPLALEENSPIWRCTINGKPIDLSDMDSAYIEYIKLWLTTPSQSLSEILDIHSKVHIYLADKQKVVAHG